MKKFNYKDVAKKIGWSFSKVNPSVEYETDYNYYREVTKHIKPTTTILDLGSGSGEKSVRYYSLAKKVYLTDIEPEMRKRAKANIEKYYAHDESTRAKFVVKHLDCRGTYPFKDESVDMVVSRHCGANLKEVYRVLKKGGLFLSEDVAADDCQELKEVFDRGQEYGDTPLYYDIYKEAIDEGFSKVDFLRFKEIEYYKSLDELKYLLGMTPILGGYDDKVDDIVLEKYLANYTTSKGIKLVRRLYAFTLVK